jgi:hypothetical protein
VIAAGPVTLHVADDTTNETRETYTCSPGPASAIRRGPSWSGRAEVEARSGMARVDSRAMSEQPAVLTERRDGVLVITLNRPEVRNAVNAAVAEGIAAALDELDADDGLAVGVLTGAGGFFCAGMDLGAFVRGESPWYGDRGFAGIAQRGSRKPLIAAIEGFAVAGGFEVALACDLIVAAEGAKLGIPEAKRSLVAARCCTCPNGCPTTRSWSSR